MKRTNYAGETSEQQIGQEVVVKGWVAKRRNLGGLIFIDLWDRSGIVQLVFDEKIDPAAFEIANQVRNQYVIEAHGLVRARKEVNPDMKTGKIEIEVKKPAFWPSPSQCRLKSWMTLMLLKNCA